jgi:hypothetical protein
MSHPPKRQLGQLPRRRPLVLVVDDDRNEGDVIAGWLIDHGFAAVVAPTCLEARAAIGAVQVDALVGDLALRDGSLFGLLQSLGEQRPSVVVGYADVDLLAPPELDAYFIRPINLGALGRFLDVWFGRKRSGQHPRFSPPSGGRDSAPPSSASSRAIAVGSGLEMPPGMVSTPPSRSVPAGMKSMPPGAKARRARRSRER